VVVSQRTGVAQCTKRFWGDISSYSIMDTHVAFLLAVGRWCCLPFLYSRLSLTFRNSLLFTISFLYPLQLLRAFLTLTAPSSRNWESSSSSIAPWNNLLFCIHIIICLEHSLRSHCLNWASTGLTLPCLCWSLFLLVTLLCLNLKCIVACGLPCLNVCLYFFVFSIFGFPTINYKALYPWAPQNLLEKVSVYTFCEFLLVFSLILWEFESSQVAASNTYLGVISSSKWCTHNLKLHSHKLPFPSIAIPSNS